MSYLPELYKEGAEQGISIPDIWMLIKPSTVRRNFETLGYKIVAFDSGFEWTRIDDADLYLHTEGTLHEAWRTLGAHIAEADGVPGVRFAVWAPNAESVAVAGEFNDWDTRHRINNSTSRRFRNSSCCFCYWNSID